MCVLQFNLVTPALRLVVVIVVEVSFDWAIASPLSMNLLCVHSVRSRSLRRIGAYHVEENICSGLQQMQFHLRGRLQYVRARAPLLFS